MKTLLRTLALAAALAPLAAQPALAQGPTPENTVIQNTASASWSDANGNSYTPVTASVSVTVGFQAGLDATSAASVTPASPSTGVEVDFAIGNDGNGTDQISVATSAAAGLTITGYRVGATTYTGASMLADLNAALAGTDIAAGGSLTVTVIYDVATGRGGQSLNLSLTATSLRDGGTSDASTTSVQPPVTSGVTVTPDGDTVDQLPSNGTQYSASFPVTNNGSAAADIDLTASTDNGTVLTIVSVNGVAGSTTTLSSVGAGATQTVVVVYTIANGAAAGAAANLELSAASGSSTDAGDLTVTVVRPAITIAKEVFRDDRSTAIDVGAGDRVAPGEFIQYRITVTNGGTATATTVSVTDALPAEVAYQSTAGDAAGWTLGESGGTVTGTLATLAGGGDSRFFWIRVQVR